MMDDIEKSNEMDMSTAGFRKEDLLENDNLIFYAKLFNVIQMDKYNYRVDNNEIYYKFG